MKNRLTQIRKSEGLSQQEFADRLNIKRGTIANYECGRNEPIDAVITLICRQFNVSEKWLRTGDGEMYLPEDRESEIAKLTVQLLTEEPYSFKNRLISSLARLSEDQWELLAKIADEITKKSKV